MTILDIILLQGYDANKVGKNETEVVIPLKHLSNFWKSLNISLINCEVELILTWSKNCVLADMTRRNAQGNNPAIVPPAEITFEITDSKVYVPVVTLPRENDIKLLDQLKLGLKRTIKWNQYRSQMTMQPENNNLNYLIDPTFTSVNRLFFCHLQETMQVIRDSFSHYYIPNVEIKDFNVLIDGKSFFDLLVKNEEEAYEKIVEMSNNNDYTTGNLLDFAYSKENYKLIAIDLRKQTKLKGPQQINFIGRLKDQNHGAPMFFIIENQKKQLLVFYKILSQS